ncbi:hypothetical protein E4J66_07860 [Actinomyces viscosus]|uniref:Uncharacterized protein n=1 Tax=Actinomyces viscosus TaxID=1656 RepID=A0A3S5EWI2_ACTVI|nr:hypothetical protein [Actinomyces viscosus]TFH52419.1 hypothetical protein E4J66_07860 [Actinomyces viscosus]VEI17193.1 Uncharacterised protein [Actinomyces viscosus]
MRQPPHPIQGNPSPDDQFGQLAIPTQSVPLIRTGPSSADHLYPPYYPTGATGAQQFYQPYAGHGPQQPSGAPPVPGGPAPSMFRAYPAAETAGRRPEDVSTPIPWRGEKLAAAALILTTCVLQVIHFLYFWQITTNGTDWIVALSLILAYLSVSPPVWWIFISIRNLLKNRPDTSMVAMSIWFALKTITLASGTRNIFSHDLFFILTIFMLLTTTVGAALSILLNKRLIPSRTAPVTLSLASCEFILTIAVLRLFELAWFEYVSNASNIDINQYTAGIWLSWSNSGGLGLTLAPGLLVTFIVMSLSLAGLILGARTSHRTAFRITAIATVSLLNIYNLFIVAVYGISAEATYAHKPLNPAQELVAALIIGAVLTGAAAAAGHRSTVPWFNRRWQYQRVAHIQDEMWPHASVAETGMRGMP